MTQSVSLSHSFAEAFDPSEVMRNPEKPVRMTRRHLTGADGHVKQPFAGGPLAMAIFWRGDNMVDKLRAEFPYWEQGSTMIGSVRET